MHLGRDVGSGCYPDVAQGFGGGAVLTSLSEIINTIKNDSSCQGLGAASSSGALAAILTWHRHRVGSPDVAQGFGGGAGFGVRPVLS